MALMNIWQESESWWKSTAHIYLYNIHWPLIHPVIHLSIHARRLNCWKQWLQAAVTQTDLGGQGAANGPSSRHICCTRWSRGAGRRPPAPTPGRWSAPPCSRRTVAWFHPGGGGRGGSRASQTGLRSSGSAEAAIQLWVTARRLSSFDREASSCRRGETKKKQRRPELEDLDTANVKISEVRAGSARSARCQDWRRQR